MTRTVRHLTALSVLFLVTAGAALAAEAGPKDKAKAVDLVRQAQRAVGQVVKIGQGIPSLALDAPDAKPFWEAVKELNVSLARAETGLALKDETFFSSVATARAAVEQAEIALAMNKVGGGAMERPMRLLSQVVTTLDQSYGKEAARLAQGGELTPEERKKLDELKAKQAELDKKLSAVEKKAGKNSKAIKEGTDKIRKNSETIKNAAYTTAGFVSAMTASRLMASSIWGWHWWWGPWGYWGPGWININIIVWDDWVEAVPYDWAIVDTYTDVTGLELEAIAFDAAELEATTQWLDTQDFSVDEADLMELTDELDVGWDDVHTEAGAAVLEGMESNFDHMPYEPEFEMDTFDDFGFDDFGFDDLGGDFDW